MSANPEDDFQNQENEEFNLDRKKIGELIRKKIILEKRQRTLDAKINILEQANKELEKKLLDDSKYRDEFEQIKNDLKNVNDNLDIKLGKLEKDTLRIKNKVVADSNKLVMIQKEQKSLSNTLNLKRQNKFPKKNFSIIAVSYLVVAILFTTYSLYTVNVIADNNYLLNGYKPVQSGFLIENLKGETIDTWVSWRLVENDVLHVNIVDAEKYPDKVDVITNTILSKEDVQINNLVSGENLDGSKSTYYKGWKGALEIASTERYTQFYIPSKFNVIKSPTGEGDIIIKLTNLSHGDGLSGETRLIADARQNQIVKAHITIYDVDKLSDVELSTIVRHEFGHAMGLAHSSDADDLMHDEIKTKYPYVSECDIDALISLYDGGKLSKVICKR